jgi:hypothetical protein
MVASRSLYALWVGTSGPEDEASGCEEGNDTIRVGYWFDSAVARPLSPAADMAVELAWAALAE